MTWGMATVEDNARDGRVIAEILGRYTYKHGKDAITTWNEWLAWCCKVFDWKCINNAGGILQRFQECKEESPLFFEAMTEWLELAYAKICKRGYFDAFGALYEANYQSSFKASSNGQFFTPTSVCDMLAKVAGNGKSKQPTTELVTFSDCACGSGRTLLSAWNECDKYNRNLFFAGDIDATSVYMCALNFMVHGMVGVVEKRNALSREWYFGFVVNACKVPMANNFSCLQYYDDENEYQKAVRGLTENAKIWNCIDFRPDEEKPQEEKSVDEIKKKTEKPKEPIQLSLFN